MTAHTQTTIVETEDGDTMICYPVKQTKYFLKTIYRVQECEALLNNARTQLRFRDSVGRYKDLMLKDFKRLVDNKNDEVSLQKYEITQLNDCIKTKDMAIRRQKLFKWTAIIVGGFVTTTEAYFLLRK